MREIAVRSARNLGMIVRARLPTTFTQFRELDEYAQLAVDIMNRRASFATFPIGSLGFMACYVALLDAETRDEIKRGKAMKQAILAAVVPQKQPFICREALSLLQEINPDFVYPTTMSRAH